MIVRRSLGSLFSLHNTRTPWLQLQQQCSSMSSLAYRRHQKALKLKSMANPPPTTVPSFHASPIITTSREMDNTTLLTLSAMKNHDARVELLKRHVQVVECCSYEDAEQTFRKIAAKQHQGIIWQTVPYQVGIVAALTTGFGSIPLCFHLPTVHWFNHHHVTTDVPEPADLETWLEVGAWSWNWMEPPLGQISFLLLCLQFSRSQLENLGIRPFTNWRKHKRAEALAKAFPQYNTKLVMNYSKTAGFFDHYEETKG